MFCQIILLFLLFWSVWLSVRKHGEEAENSRGFFAPVAAGVIRMLLLWGAGFFHELAIPQQLTILMVVFYVLITPIRDILNLPKKYDAFSGVESVFLHAFLMWKGGLFHWF